MDRSRYKASVKTSDAFTAVEGLKSGESAACDMRCFVVHNQDSGHFERVGCHECTKAEEHRGNLVFSSHVGWSKSTCKDQIPSEVRCDTPCEQFYTRFLDQLTVRGWLRTFD